MQKTVLNDVFELLVQIGAVSSESEFSKDWLCRSECYMRTLLYHFHKMIELADIADREVRDLVPYSLRHFMITQRIMSGLTFRHPSITGVVH